MRPRTRRQLPVHLRLEVGSVELLQRLKEASPAAGGGASLDMGASRTVERPRGLEKEQYWTLGRGDPGHKG